MEKVFNYVFHSSKGLDVINYALLLGLIFSVGCNSKKEATEVEKAPVVKVETVTLHEVNLDEEINGNVEAFEVANIAPQIAGRIEKIYFEVGDHVSKGQKIVDMDSLQYLQTKIQLQNIEKDSPRMKALHEAGAISDQQYDQHQTNLDVTKTALKNLHNNISIYSPVNGVVTGKYFEDRELFIMSPNSSGDVAIVTVMQINPVKVLVNISETFYPMIRLGMRADVKLDLYPNKEFEGRVYRIHPTIDPLTRTFVVEVEVPNAKEELKPGMFARVNLNLGHAERILVDDVAVMKQAGSNDRYVYVIESGVAIRKNVKIGRRIENKLEIISGLKPGEVVVKAGQSRLQTNIKVEIIK